MAKYHVGAGLFGIYAGTVKNNGTEWKDKTDCTDEAINAVRDFMITDLLGGLNCNGNEITSNGYKWTLKDGRTVKLMIEIVGADMRESE